MGKVWRLRIRAESSRLCACGLVAVAVLLLVVPAANGSSLDFGLERTSATLETGQAGGHSDLETKLLFRGNGELDERGNKLPWGNVRKLVVELPPGLVGTPAAFPACDTESLVEQGLGLPGEAPAESCSPDAQVGVIEPGAANMFPPGALRLPLINLDRPPRSENIVARFGFLAFGTPVFMDMRLDSRRDYAVTATLDSAPEGFPVTGAYTTFWGVPTDHSHDSERSTFAQGVTCQTSCPPIESGLPPTAFLGNPTSCADAEAGLAATSYEVEEGADYAFPDIGQISGCSRVPFEPSLSVNPTTRHAAAPSGLDVSLEIPQEGLTQPNALRSADLKNAVVTLPEGVSLDPSSVDGMGGCSQREMGVEGNELQIADVGGRGAPVALSFDGHQASPVPAFSTPDRARSALESLPGIGPGDVAVSGRPGGPWTVDFGGALSARDVPAIAGVQSEMQQLVAEGKEGSSFRLVFEGEATSPIGLKAQAAEVQSALEALGAVSPGDVRVSGGATSGISAPVAGAFDIAFEGSLAGSNVPPLTAEWSAGSGTLAVSTLTEGGSPVATHTVKQGGSLTFNEEAPRCPESSKVASGQITTPMVGNPISASVYLADQGDDPSGSTFAGYLVAAGEGLLVKMPARLDLDPATGRVRATFSDIPQLPLSKIDLHFKGGDRGLLTTPRQCGTYDSRYELTPWSGAPPAAGTARMTIDEGCRPSGLDVGFRAGSSKGVAGAFSPFVAQVTRSASSVPVTKVAVDLPPGMAAKLAGVGRCPDKALSRLADEPRAGLTESISPVCPADSQVGTVVVGMGSGLPFYSQAGKAYLTGPYRGAPLGLALVVPALAGPFDLGNVLVRAAVSVDFASGRVEAVSDPLPSVVEGIPVELRDLRINLDRPGFVINPTSCDETAVNGSISGEAQTSARVSNRFQVGDCGHLGFRPRIRLNFAGVTARNGHPDITIEVAGRAADANLASMAFTLPAGELLDPRHIRSICGQSLPIEHCPRSSRLGYARVRSPLLEASLKGPIYLRTPSGGLPDLVADLRGDGFHFLLHGYTTSPPGRLSIRFPNLPDLPLARAAFTLAGGPHGIIANSESLCAVRHPARIGLSAHTGRRIMLAPTLHVRGRC